MNLKNEIFIHSMIVKKRDRSLIKKHRSCIIWLTGLSGAGKSTIADLLEEKLNKQGKHTFLLDGDNLRHTLNQDLGFSDDDRNENIRRIGHVGKLMVDAGLIVIASFISPFEKQRKLTRELFEKDEYIEVFLNTPLEVCEKRDTKGLYKKARSGQIKDFTGIDSAYEIPKNSEITLDGEKYTADELSDKIINYLSENKILKL
jgi:adenylyl-sulfate kinase